MQENSKEERQTFWIRLKNRRVPQIFFIYLAASWTVLQFTDWVVNRYTLSPYLTDLCLTILLAMIPSILIVAYFHGAPGRNQWHRAEIMGIPVNVLIVFVLVYGLFSGKDLGSTQEKVAVSDETGALVEKLVPKSQFRKKIALFFMENRSGNPEHDWLQYALTNMLEMDLSQDMYIEVLSPGSQNFGGSFFVFNKIRDAGSKTGLGLPLMLMKKIAGEFHQEFFMSGGLDYRDDLFRIDYVLYRTRDMKPLDRGQVEHKDVFDAVDLLSVALKRGMDIPSGHIDSTADLPIGEIFTRSIPAARVYTEGLREMVLHQAWKKAQSLLEESLEIDPGMAYARLQLSGLYAQSSQAEKWRDALKSLMQQSYKLPERMQSLVKFGYYSAMSEPDKAMAVLDMMAGLYPEDTQVYYMRAQMRIARSQLDLALSDYRQIRELDPQNHDILKSMASVHEMKAEYEQAEKCLLEYSQAFPANADVLLSLGKIKRKQGHHEQAKEYFQRAQILRPDEVGILIELGCSEFDSGRFGENQSILEKALSLARSAEDKYTVLNALEEYYTKRGQLKRALQTFDEKMVQHKAFSVPILSVVTELDRAELLVLNGRAEEAYKGLDRLKAQMSPPFDKYVALGYIGALLAQRRYSDIELHLDEVRDLIKQMGVKTLEAYLLRVRARIAELSGDYETALRLCLEVKARSPAASLDRSLVICYRGLKQYTQAEAVLEKALLVSPFDAALNREAALLYRDMGRPDKGLEHLKRAEWVWQEADPGYERAVKLRELLAGWPG